MHNDVVPRRSTLALGSFHSMEPNEVPPPTFESFGACAEEAFGYLAKYGFARSALPEERFINRFQVRFGNGKLTIAIAGIHWGTAILVNLLDASDTEVPLGMFVPSALREAGRRSRRKTLDQLAMIRIAAEAVQNYCSDLLQGDMTRFHDRAKEWRRITGQDRSYQKRELP
jgi:hypothetical protein